VASAAAAVVLVALASGVATAGTGPKAKPPKPTPTVTSTRTPTPTATPTPTPTPTVTPTPTACVLGTVLHDGATWCRVTPEDVALDRYPVGTAVALLGVVPEEVWGGVMYLYAGDDCPPQPEPPGEPIFCGATVRTVAVDVSAVTVPPPYVYVDVWGVVTASAWVTASGLEVRP